MKFLDTHSLKHKILIYTILVSSLMSAIFTLYSLVLDYKIGVEKLDERIKNIEITTLGSLKGALWDLNIGLIKVQLSDLIQVEGIKEIRLIDETSNEIVNLKSPKKTISVNEFEKSYPLNFENENQSIYGGTLFIKFSRDHIYAEVTRRALIVLITQFLKTFFVSFVLIFIYEKLITKDLIKISKYLENLDVSGTNEKLIFSIERKTEDEITLIQKQLNAMTKKLVELNIENEQLLKEANNERKLQEAKALNAARLASLGEMAAGIAHEINNPLTIVKSGIFSIEKKMNAFSTLSEVDQKILTRVNIAIERIVKIIRNMKKISRDGTQSEIENLPLKDLLADTIDYYIEKFAKKDIVFKFSNFSNTRVQVREIEINQAIMNLLNNSFDAISDKEYKWVKIEEIIDGGYLYLLISDSGTGIDAINMKKIFNPFFTTKDVGKGTGLGLSISKEAIEKMGGELSLEHDRENTTFKIKLKITPS